MSARVVSTWSCLATHTAHTVGAGCGAGGEGESSDKDAEWHVKQTKHATISRQTVEGK